ncbi:NUDIX domain-containing protein [Levilactobacillus acidifarinae]|uniref:NUDIX family hydrolase n=1 Tax=Levilactobacillus acidifarinae DSM 19394 = JCM 15949 TaxID=1423715 RepID=A0A0R1LPR3_9LACO|nr:NUDIX hydrolase [Levilactobacillus acidifarinae]KRK94817.1 NUDIX family hydrolase [Levilactobacillus acidifarinae DSM 19394]GEO68576.1 ADP-ribose pyrophosphatase [Levilactobacillus acidifarinae]
MDLEEHVESSETLYDGVIVRLERQQVRLPNGEAATREIVRHVGAVGILALPDADHMILERQWRAPIAKATLEIPAGKLDSRDADNIEHAVRRELNEEIRYEPGTLKRITGFYSSVGFSDEYMTLFLATDLKPVTTKLPRDQGENLELLTVTKAEAQAMIDRGEIEDAKTITAIYYWLLQK